MGLFDRILGGLRSNQNSSDDDYFLDDDYYGDDDSYEEEAPRKGIVRNNRSSENSESRSGGLFGSRKNVVSMSSVPNMQVSMKRPKNVNDFTSICDDLLDGMAVVINLEGISQDQAQRIIDFTYGAIYSIQGDLKMISKYIFIASPHSVALSGEFAEDFNVTERSNNSYSSSRASGFYN